MNNLVNRRRAIKAPGKTDGIRAKYIETDGLAYLDTGIIQTSTNFELTLVAQWTGSTSSQFETFFGYIVAGNENKPRDGIGKRNGKWMYGTNTTVDTSVNVDSSKHTFFIDSYKNDFSRLYLDGTQVNAANMNTSNDIGISENTTTYYLGARNKITTVDNPCCARFYGLNYKIYDNVTHTNLVLEYNFIPYFKDGVFGMYDTVSNTFIHSIGSTEFTGEI